MNDGVIVLVSRSGTYLEQCAQRVHTEYGRTLIALGDSVEALFAVGHALLDARRALPSDQAFGLWFRQQNFGFSRQWGHRLRQAAELEPEVRAVVASQLATGKPSIEAAVRTVRAALAQHSQEDPEPMTAAAIATVTPISDRRPRDERVEHIRQGIALGLNVVQIADELGITTHRTYVIAKAAGIPLGKNSRAARAQRVEQMRVLAKQGATSRQIADELGVGIGVVWRYGRDHDIAIPADATTHPTRVIDSTRIVSTTIDTVDGIGVMFDHIDYAALPAEDVDGWVDVLNSSIRSLTNLRKRLKELTQP